MEVAIILQTSTAIVLPVGFATFLAQSGNDTASLSRLGITLVISVHVSTLSCFKL
jgi:predicted chitinase